MAITIVGTLAAIRSLRREVIGRRLRRAAASRPMAHGLRGPDLRLPVRPDRRPDRLQLQRKANFIWHGSRSTGTRPFSGTRTCSTRSGHAPGRRIAVVGSTILGTLLGLGLARLRFRGSGAVQTLLLLPMITPEIIMGISLLVFFSQLFG